MDFQSNCQGARTNCFEDYANVSYEKISEEFQPSGSSSCLKSNYAQDCNEEELPCFETKQKSSRRIPRKFSRSRPLTEEELDRKRVTANVQERRRMQRLNTALEKLKGAIPPHLHMQYRRLSKIKTLKLAIDYIGFLEEILKPNFGGKCGVNSSHVQIFETEGFSTYNSEAYAAANVMLEDDGLIEHELPNHKPSMPTCSTSVICTEVLQHHQCSSYFVDHLENLTSPRDNEGFHYLEQF